LTFSYWFDKPRFLTEGILDAVLITPSLGVPNWSVIYINTAQQSLTAISTVQPAWLASVQASYLSDHTAQALL
jgi:hypothetical protein